MVEENVMGELLASIGTLEKHPSFNIDPDFIFAVVAGDKERAEAILDDAYYYQSFDLQKEGIESVLAMHDISLDDLSPSQKDDLSNSLNSYFSPKPSWDNEVAAGEERTFIYPLGEDDASHVDGFLESLSKQGIEASPDDEDKASIEEFLDYARDAQVAIGFKVRLDDLLQAYVDVNMGTSRSIEVASFDVLAWSGAPLGFSFNNHKISYSGGPFTISYDQFSNMENDTEECAYVKDLDVATIH